MPTTLDAGRYTLTETLAGTVRWGVHRFTAATGQTVLATTAPLRRPADLQVPTARVAGVAEVLGVVAVDGTDDGHALLEAEPDGRRWGEPTPLAVPDLQRLGRTLLQTVAGWHQRTGQPLGGMHPQTLWWTASGPVCVAHGWRMRAASPHEFQSPPFPASLEPPETALRGQRLPASDVFAVVALLAWAATGVPPLGRTVPEALLALSTWDPGRAQLPDVLEPLRPALDPEPARRPSAADLARHLAFHLAG